MTKCGDRLTKSGVVVASVAVVHLAWDVLMFVVGYLLGGRP